MRASAGPDLAGQQVREDAGRAIETMPSSAWAAGGGVHSPVGVLAALWPGIRGGQPEWTGGIFTLVPMRSDSRLDQGDGSGDTERGIDVRNYPGGKSHHL